MKNRIELRDYVRFQLSQLGTSNGAHAFEQLCFELARLRHAPNLLPATGPVQSGGDQGRDFESYRTFLAKTPIAQSSFAARAADELIAGACTLERNNLPRKIKSDLKSMFASGERPSHVLYFCQADLPVAQRHKLQEHCRATYDARLEIHDGQAMADQLVDADTFWIASQFLNVPADFYPEDQQDEDYAALRARWLSGSETPSRYADFLEIKLGLRTATFEESVRQDLERWLACVRTFEAQSPPGRLKQKARYEIGVAELRGRGNLDPARLLIEAFFAALPDETPRAVDLLDAAVLAVYCWGAVQTQQTTLEWSSVQAWAAQVETLVGAAEAATTRRGDRCTLLEARAMLAILVAGAEGRPVAIARTLTAWSDVLKLVKETPHYPVAHVAELVDRLAPLVGQEPAFRDLRDQIDDLTETRTGKHAVAARSYRRALAQFEAGNRLGAIDELQRAKLGWFSGDEMARSVMAMLLLAECYDALHLPIAARYYAAGAAYIAVNSDDDEVRSLTPLASFGLASSYFGAGEGLSFLKTLGSALQLYGALTPNNEGPVRAAIDDGVTKAAVLVHLVRELAPDLTASVAELVANWPIDAADFEAAVDQAGAEGSPWAAADREGLTAIVATEMGLAPFTDLGERRVTRWSALGLQWEIGCSADPATQAVALSLAAILQVLQVELADSELLLIPTTAVIEVHLGDTQRPRVRELRSAQLGWEVMMPRQVNPADDGLSDAMSVVATVLGEASAMSMERFKTALERAFSRGLTYRASSVRPAREMMEFAAAQVGDTAAILRATAPVALKGPFAPLEAEELAWPTTPGPGYSSAKAQEALANRYRRPFEIAGPSLQRVLADTRVRGLLQDVRADGYRDWQILNTLMSLVAQRQAQAHMANPRDVSALSTAVRERALRAERDDDAQINLEEITADSLREMLYAQTAACLATWGLQLNRMGLDPDGVKRLLDVRYRQSEDDIPHSDILAA